MEKYSKLNEGVIGEVFKPASVVLRMIDDKAAANSKSIKIQIDDISSQIEKLQTALQQLQKDKMSFETMTSSRIFNAIESISGSAKEFDNYVAGVYMNNYLRTGEYKGTIEVGIVLKVKYDSYKSEIDATVEKMLKYVNKQLIVSKGAKNYKGEDIISIVLNSNVEFPQI